MTLAMPCHVPIPVASAQTGIPAATIYGLTLHDPRPELDDTPPVRYTIDRKTGERLVLLEDVQFFVGVIS